ncbi:multidrug resistance protein, partial [Pseudomonas savastanoi pv. glycinea str. race 4]
PRNAVSRSASGQTTVLLVVDGRIEQRVISVDRTGGNQLWVSSGLKANEQVVVEGGQKTPVGTEVSVQNADSPNSPSPSGTVAATDVKEH